MLTQSKINVAKNIKRSQADYYFRTTLAGALLLLLLLAFGPTHPWAETGQIDDQVPAVSSPLIFEKSLETGVGAELILDLNLFQSIKSQRQVKVTGFPLAPGRAINLELEQFFVFDDRTQFVAGTNQGDQPLPAPDVVLLRGKATGYPDSRVFLGLSPFGCNGHLILGEETFIVTSRPGRDPRGQRLASSIFEQSSIEWAPGRVWCGGGIEIPESERISPPRVPKDTRQGEYKICDLAVDADWEYYHDLFENDQAAALAYMAELIAAVSTIYDRDINGKLYLCYARVWTTSEDPYDSAGSTSGALNEFRNYWRANMGSVWRTLAHKFSGTEDGGIAYVDFLCDIDMGYALSCLNGGPSPIPTWPGDNTWDLVVVAHELGHNFGSRHTHCYDPPIDRCYNCEGCPEDGTCPGYDEDCSACTNCTGTCFRGTVVLTRGTIMSYCHLGYGGQSNIDLNFHPRVIARIDSSVQAATCMEIGHYPTIFVDRSNTGFDDGTINYPFNTVEEAIGAVAPGGFVKIRSGNYPETVIISDSMTLEKWGIASPTPVVIGE